MIGVIHVINETISILKSIDNLKKTKFESLFELLSQRNGLLKSISVSEVSDTFEINNFFLKNKILLSGCDLNENEIHHSNSETEQQIMNNESKMTHLNSSNKVQQPLCQTDVKSHTSNLIPRLESKILNHQNLQKKNFKSNTRAFLFNDKKQSTFSLK